jgi:recombination protein RecR
LSNFSSKILEETVSEFSRLPGIGKRTALRLVLHLLKADKEDAQRLGESLIRLHKEISFCKVCHNITEKEICDICSDPKRDRQYLCIVEDIRDVLAIENTQQYHGLYHILGGIISPMDGIGPNDLNIPSLLERIRSGTFTEIIIALPATMEGDTTSFFLFKKISQSEHPEVKFSTIARGISVGSDLEFADEVTLGRSILQRVPYENSLLK